MRYTGRDRASRSEKTQGCWSYCLQSQHRHFARVYPEIVGTHTFQNRLDTIAAIQQSGMSVCCGGIVGMGESEKDRLRMLEVLSNFDPPPESVPINCLMAMPGTPLAARPPVDIFELVRLIAVARIACRRDAPDCRAKGRRSASLQA